MLPDGKIQENGRKSSSSKVANRLLDPAGAYRCLTCVAYSSVHEHDKMARTPLAAFFNIPEMGRPGRYERSFAITSWILQWCGKKRELRRVIIKDFQVFCNIFHQGVGRCMCGVNIW